MAYGEKYHLEFTDQQGAVIRCNIYLNGYGGSSTEVKGSGSPIVINYDDKGMMNPIRSSQATLTIQSETDLQFSEFFTAGNLDYYLEIKKDGTAIWYGTFITETYSEPYVVVPYNVMLRFTDFGALKYIDFDPTGLNAVDEFLDVVNSILGELPYSHNLKDLVNVFPDEISETANDSFLSKVICHPESFRFLNGDTGDAPYIKCWEALERICESHGAAFMQSEGFYWLIRIEEYTSASITFVEYTAGTTTVQSTGSISIRKNITNSSDTITYLHQDGVLDITDVYNTIVYQFPKDQDTIPAGEIILDSEIMAYYNESAAADQLKLWEINGTGVTAGADVLKSDYQNILVANPNNPGVVLMLKDDMLVSSLDSTKYIRALKSPNDVASISKQVYLQTDSILSLELRFGFTLLDIAYTAANNNLIFEVSIPIRIKVGTKYLTDDGAGNLSWGNTDTWVEFKVNKLLGSWTIGSAASGLGYYAFYPIELTVETPVYVANGMQDVIFDLGAPISTPLNQGNVTLAEVFFQKISLINKRDGNTQFSGYKITYDSISDKKDRELVIETSFGDPDNVYTKTLQGMLWTGPTPLVATTSWHTRGNAEAIPHSKIFILEPYSKFYSTYRKKITATLYGDEDFAYHNALILKEDGTVLHITGFSYELKSGEKKIKAEEISQTTPTVDIVDSVGTISNDDAPVVVKGGLPYDEIDTHVSIKGLILPGGGFVNSDVAISNETGFIKTINDSKGHVTHYIKTP